MRILFFLLFIFFFAPAKAQWPADSIMRKADYVVLGQLVAIDSVKQPINDLRTGNISCLYFLRTAHNDPWPDITVPNIPGSALLTAHYFFFIDEIGYQRFKILPGGIVPHSEKLEKEIVEYYFNHTDSSCGKSGFRWPLNGFNRSPLMTERLLSMTGPYWFREKLIADIPCLLESGKASLQLKKELLCFLFQHTPDNALLPLMNLSANDSLTGSSNSGDNWKECDVASVLSEYLRKNPKRFFELLPQCSKAGAYYSCSLLYFLEERSRKADTKLKADFEKQGKKIPEQFKKEHQQLMTFISSTMEKEAKK